MVLPGAGGAGNGNDRPWIGTTIWILSILNVWPPSYSCSSPMPAQKYTRGFRKLATDAGWLSDYESHRVLHPVQCAKKNRREYVEAASLPSRKRPMRKKCCRIASESVNCPN